METWVLAAGCPIRHRPFTSTDWKKKKLRFDAGKPLGMGLYRTGAAAETHMFLHRKTASRHTLTERENTLATSDGCQATVDRLRPLRPTELGHSILRQTPLVAPRHVSMTVHGEFLCSCIDCGARSWHILTPSLFVLVHLRRRCRV